MKTGKGFRSFTALLLTLALSLACFAAPAAGEAPADTDDPVKAMNESVTVGNVTVELDDDGTAVIVSAHGADAAVTVQGDVTLTVTDREAVDVIIYGIEVDATKVDKTAAVTATVTVTGDVTVEGSGGDSSSSTGIDACAQHPNNKVDVTVDGDVTVSGISSIGVDASALSENAVGAVEIGGDVTVSGDYSYGVVAYATLDGSETTVLVKGDVTATGTGSTGVYLDFYGSDPNNDINILVEGTLSAENPILISDDTLPDDGHVTVWKLESTKEDGELVIPSKNNQTNVESFAKAINYIVKTTEGLTNEQVATANGNTVLVTDDGSILFGNADEEYLYHIANEDEEVTLTFGEEEGKGLEGVYYNAEDKTGLIGIDKLTKDGNGKYTATLKMLRGGGMLLGLASHMHTGTATCTAPAVCTVCGKSFGSKDPDNHSLAAGQAKAPTCTEDGWDAYQYCTRDGCGYTTKVIIQAKGHTPVEDKAVEADCTHTGLTKGSHCSVCSEVLEKQETVAAKGHTPVEDKAVEADCTHTGLTKGSHCSVCSEVLEKQEVVPALGHDFGEWTQTRAPSCEGKGEELRICKRDGCETVEKRDVDALGHTEEKDPAVAATCTTAGKTAGSHCSVCGKAIVAQTTVPAKGHDQAAPVKENEKAAQIGVAGSYDEVVYCKDCGAELSRRTVTIPSLPDPEPESEPIPQPDPEPKPEPVPVMNTASKLIEVFDEEEKVKITFYSDRTFKVHMENGAVENGTFRNENGRLVLYCATGSVAVDEDGSFTYVSLGNLEVKYDFRISPQGMQKLLEAAK